MSGIVADHNIEGHVRRLVELLERSLFCAEWLSMKMAVHTVVTLGFTFDVDDRSLWNYCQEHGIVIVTANRNSQGDDSLGVAILESGPESLPVFTLADSERVLNDDRYAEAVAIELLEKLQDILNRPETILGSGRIFLPMKPIV